MIKQLAFLAFDLWRPENTEYCLECLIVIVIHTTRLSNRCLASSLSLTASVGEEMLTPQFGARRRAAVGLHVINRDRNSGLQEAREAD